jgi:hypothetical protein
MKVRSGVVAGLVATVVAGAMCLNMTYAATFSRIIGPFDPFPDSGDTVRQVREAVVDASGTGDFLVVLNAGLESSSFQALYRVNAANEFQRIAAQGTATSRGAAVVSFGQYALHGGMVYLVAFDEAFNHYLCRVSAPGGEVTVIAAKGDVLAGLDRYDGFVGGLAAHSGGLAFDASVNRDNGTRFYNDVLHYDGESVISMVGYGTTPVPGAPGASFFMNKVTAPVVHGGEAIFLGEGLIIGLGSVTGIYAFPLPGQSGEPRKLVDSRDAAPGTAQPFSVIGRSSIDQPLFDFDSGEAAFYATSAQQANAGLYRHTEADGIALVVNQDTAVPGGTQRFQSDAFAQGMLGFAGGRLVFRAMDELGSDGLYVQEGGVLERLIATGDEVDGTALNIFELYRHGLGGDQLIFSANFALYRALLDGGSQPTPVSLEIERIGDELVISWDGVQAGPGAVLEWSSSLVNPEWEGAGGGNPFSADLGVGGQRYYRLRQ